MHCATVRLVGRPCESGPCHAPRDSRFAADPSARGVAAGACMIRGHRPRLSQSASRRGTRLTGSQRQSDSRSKRNGTSCAFGVAPLARHSYSPFQQSSPNQFASIVTFSVGTRYGNSPLIPWFPRFRFTLLPKFQDAPVSDNDFQVESHAFSEAEQISREGGCVAGEVIVAQKLSARDTSIACHPIIGHGAIQRLCLPFLSRHVFGEWLEILRKLEYIVHPLTPLY